MTEAGARQASGMHAAQAQARRGMARGEPPFGAVIIDAAGRLLAAQHDRVVEFHDMSAHAEVLAVRQACAAAGPDLSGATLYTTCEPCPMCYTAAWLARVGTIVYGTTMAQVHARMGGLQRELRIGVDTINGMHPEPLRLVGGVAADACLALFDPETVPGGSATAAGADRAAADPGAATP